MWPKLTLIYAQEFTRVTIRLVKRADEKFMLETLGNSANGGVESVSIAFFTNYHLAKEEYDRRCRKEAIYQAEKAMLNVG